MGVWGYGYQDNDNYYNGVGGFVEPLIVALRSAIEYGREDDLEDIRARLMWTAQVLRATDEYVPLSEDHLRIFRVVVTYVREAAVENAESWRKPDEYLRYVEAELQSVERWLGTFEEQGFLEDRMGAIAEVMFKDEETNE